MVQIQSNSVAAFHKKVAWIHSAEPLIAPCNKCGPPPINFDSRNSADENILQWIFIEILAML